MPGSITSQHRVLNNTGVVHPDEVTQPAPPRLRLLTPNAVNLATSFIVLMVSAWVMYAPLRQPARIMPFVEDDFYYYLKVAQNVAAGLGSTFDGTTRTNGYHPLYFLLLVFVSKCATSLAGVFRALWVVWVLAAQATFLLARKQLERRGSGPFLTNAMAMVFLIPCLHIFCQGMEINLTLPLGLGLLLVFGSKPSGWSLGYSAGVGLLAALTILSRLDAVFLVLLLLVFTLFEPEQRRGIGFRQSGGFALGGAPLLLAYFMLNRVYFHAWMPISGTAKQLKSSPWPTLTAIKYGGLNNTYLVLFLLYAVVAFFLLRKRLAPGERAVLAAAAAFPFLQIGAFSFVSDWPLWGWYYYSLRFALLSALVLLLALAGSARIDRQPQWIKIAAYGIALLLLLRVHWKKEGQMDQLYDVVLQIRAFQQSHPGIYAMGGGAGMTGYLLQEPLIQTEGLMMDPAFLQHIRSQDNLLSTLRSYGVRYYIAFEVTVPVGFDRQREGSCFLAEEPYNVGRAALRMSAKLCRPPVANVILAKDVIGHIFDLQQQ